MSALGNKPTVIEAQGLKFLIMDAPKDSNLHLYLKEMKKHGVNHIARISEPSYSAEEVEKAGIQLHELFFVDGASPPNDIIKTWLSIVSSTFDGFEDVEPKPCIAIHCVAGLGRAPVMVAIALIEYGMDPLTAVAFIRERRRGSINQIQLAYLESYKRTRKSSKKCVIM